MPNYFAAYGTLRLHPALAEFPGRTALRHIAPCKIPGHLYQMGGFPVLKQGSGSVCGDLFEVPWNFDFKTFDRYEDYHPTRPWACRYVRRQICLIAPKVEAWVYIYVWPVDMTTRYWHGDWIQAVDLGIKARRFRGDRMPLRKYRPAHWPHGRAKLPSR